MLVVVVVIIEIVVGNFVSVVDVEAVVIADAFMDVDVDFEVDGIAAVVNVVRILVVVAVVDDDVIVASCLMS